MDTWFVVLLIGAGILSAAGPIIWTSAILRSGGDACACNEAGNGTEPAHSPPERVIRRLDSTLGQLDRLVRAACRRGPGARGLPGAELTVSPYMQLRIQTMFMESYRCVRRLDDASRERYESRIANLSDMAATVGISWSPGPRRDKWAPGAASDPMT